MATPYPSLLSKINRPQPLDEADMLRFAPEPAPVGPMAALQISPPRPVPTTADKFKAIAPGILQVVGGIGGLLTSGGGRFPSPVFAGMAQAGGAMGAEQRARELEMAKTRREAEAIERESVNDAVAELERQARIARDAAEGRKVQRERIASQERIARARLAAMRGRGAAELPEAVPYDLFNRIMKSAPKPRWQVDPLTGQSTMVNEPEVTRARRYAMEAVNKQFPGTFPADIMAPLPAPPTPPAPEEGPGLFRRAIDYVTGDAAEEQAITAKALARQAMEENPGNPISVLDAAVATGEITAEDRDAAVDRLREPGSRARRAARRRKSPAAVFEDAFRPGSPVSRRLERLRR